MIHDAMEWATHEFGRIPRLDKRLQVRLITSAAGIAERPTLSSLPQRLQWNELRGTYRLIDRLSEYPELLQHVHRQRTRERMDPCRTVLILQDDTTLSCS